jgi:predicted butyrate kinase (DUF1464 family)
MRSSGQGQKTVQEGKGSASGAYMIGEGLLGGRYRELVENMGITA